RRSPSFLAGCVPNGGRQRCRRGSDVRSSHVVEIAPAGDAALLQAPQQGRIFWPSTPAGAAIVPAPALLRVAGRVRERQVEQSVIAAGAAWPEMLHVHADPIAPVERKPAVADQAFARPPLALALKRAIGAGKPLDQRQPTRACVRTILPHPLHSIEKLALTITAPLAEEAPA